MAKVLSFGVHVFEGPLVHAMYIVVCTLGCSVLINFVVDGKRDAEIWLQVSWAITHCCNHQQADIDKSSHFELFSKANLCVSIHPHTLVEYK